MQRRGRALRLSVRQGGVVREGRRSGGRRAGRTGERGLQAPPAGRRGGRGLMAGRRGSAVHRAAAVVQGGSLRIRRGLAASPSGPSVRRGGGPGASLAAWAVAGLSRGSLARRLGPRRLAMFQGAQPGGAQSGGSPGRGSRGRHRRARGASRRGRRVVRQACEVEDRGTGARRGLVGRGGGGWLSGRHVNRASYRRPAWGDGRWGDVAAAPSVRDRMGSRRLGGNGERARGRMGGRC